VLWMTWRAPCARPWEAVIAALNAGGGGSRGGDATQAEFEWARATAHTRAMGGDLGGAPCAFIVPGAGANTRPLLSST